ncbi:MAG: tetratricopeptide repeat protein, partial [Acidobacteriota bacterium]
MRRTENGKRKTEEGILHLASAFSSVLRFPFSVLPTPTKRLAALLAGACLLALLTTAWAAPRRVFLRMIVSSTESQAVQAVQRLEAGEPFAQVAREASGDPSAHRGGFLGEMWFDKMNQAFRSAAESLQPDRYSEPFQLGRAWVILYRMEKGFRDRAIQLSEEADAVLEKGETEKALQIYRQSVELDPEFIHGYFKLGVAQGKAGRPDLEARAYRQAIEIEPDYFQAYYNLGALLLSQQDYWGAIRAFQGGLRIDPNRVYCQVNLISAYLAVGQRDQAIRSGRKALEINPLLPMAHYNLGVAYGEVEPEKALHSFQMASALDPSNTEFPLSIVIALSHLGRFDEARRTVQDLLQQHPGMEKARQALADLEQMAADRPQPAQPRPTAASTPSPAPAGPQSASAGSSGTASAENLADQARQALGRGDFRTALQLYERAVALKPAWREIQFQRAWTRVALGKALQSQGQWENAIQVWEQALAGFPGFVPALEAMTRAAITQGRFGAADEFLARARRAEPDNPELAIAASRLHYERRDLESAFAELAKVDPDKMPPAAQIKLLEQLTYLDLDEDALRLFGRLDLPANQMLQAVNHLIRASLFEEAESYLKGHPSPYALTLLGKLYSRQLRFDEARQVLEGLLKKDPRAWSAYYFLGQVHTNAGQGERAIEALQKALQMEPANVNILYQLGLAANQAGQAGRAGQWLGRGLELSPSSFQLNFEMGRLLLDAGN